MIMEKEQTAGTGAGNGTVRWRKDRTGTVRLYTARELTEVLRLSEAKVWSLLGKGVIDSIKIDSSRRVTQQALDDYIDRLAAEEKARREGSAA
jgi:hypothetical protein